jgi:phage/plasmid-like protein (TIGR03299 family)
MAHNIHRKLDGTYMAMYVGQSPWHGLGVVTDIPQTAEGIYRDVFGKRVITLVPAFAKIGGKYVEVPETAFTADRKTGQVFAPVGADYSPIQDITALRILEALPKVTHKKAAFVSAFALGNGARAAATLDLTRYIGEKALAVLRDQSAMQAYLVADWAHDGSGALKIMDSVVRVDCQNMLNAANINAANRGRLVRIVHSGSERTIEEQLREAERTLGFAVDSIKLSTKFLNDIAAIALPKPDQWFSDFTEQLVPIPEDMDRPSQRVQVREALKELWAKSPNLQTVPKSPYRGLQAVTEYADHFRPLRIGADQPVAVVAERRFRSITEGPANELKSRAAELIRQEFEVR